MTQHTPYLLTIDTLYAILFRGMRLELPEQALEGMWASYRFLEDFATDKVIYGINTGFGPMAQWRVSDAHLRDLQYNIIRSHATGAGRPLGSLYVKAAMLARLGTFLSGHSGVHPEVVRLLEAFVNADVCPFIPEHGSVGASGDLVQLAHLALCLIGEGQVLYQGSWQPTGSVLSALGLQPIGIHLREGLSAANGTSVMTGISLVNLYYAETLLDYALLASVWLNEIAGSYDDFLAAPLHEARRHPGQRAVATVMRQLAHGSRCLRQRAHELYDPEQNGAAYFEHKVQAYYSLRCIPQILGPILETLSTARRILEDELNAASDNPIVDVETQQVYHGGNFHGDYISLEADKMKIVMTRLAMTAERQLNYLCHDRINGILPPFLNLGTLGLNYGIQACQFTATSTTAECQTLSMPNYVHSIPNNNDNQDIVSMGTNSALLCRQVIDNAYQVLSIHLIALAQATDCLGLVERLAPATAALYAEIRLRTEPIREDRPLYADISRIEDLMRQQPLGLLTPRP